VVGFLVDINMEKANVWLHRICNECLAVALTP